MQQDLCNSKTAHVATQQGICNSKTAYVAMQQDLCNSKTAYVAMQQGICNSKTTNVATQQDLFYEITNLSLKFHNHFQYTKPMLLATSRLQKMVSKICLWVPLRNNSQCTMVFLSAYTLVLISDFTSPPIHIRPV